MIGATWFRSLGIALAAMVVIWIGNSYGLWYGAMVVGGLLGFTVRSNWRGFLLACLASVGAWGLALAWQARHLPLVREADVIAGIMGLGAHGQDVIILTLFIAFLLGAVGTWIGTALSAFTRPHVG